MTRRQFLKQATIGTAVITVGVQLSLLDRFLNLFKKPKVKSLPVKEEKTFAALEGKSLLESGYIWCPYIPLVVTPVIFSPDNFNPIKGKMTRTKSISKEYYCVNE